MSTKNRFVLVIVILLLFILSSCKTDLPEDKKIALNWVINDVSSMMKTEQDFNTILENDLEILEKNKEVLEKNIEIENNFDNYKEHPDWNKGLEIPKYLRIDSKNMEVLCNIIETEDINEAILKQLNDIEITVNKNDILTNTQQTLLEMEEIFCSDKSYNKILNYAEYEKEMRESKESIEEYLEMQRQAELNKLVSGLEKDAFSNGYAVIEFEGKYGIVNDKKEIITEPIYDKIGEEAFSNGLARVMTEEGKWGYVNKEAEMVIDAVYDEASPFNVNGYADVTKDGEAFVINKNGERKKDVDYWNLLKRRFVVSELSIIWEIIKNEDEYSSETINFKQREYLTRNIIVLPKNGNSVMWEFPIQYEKGSRISLAIYFFYNGSLKIEIKHNTKVLGEETWNNEAESPLIIKKNGETVERIAFIKDWSPKISENSENITSIEIKSKSFIDVEEKERKIEDVPDEETETDEENKKEDNFIKFKFPQYKVNKNYFTEAYVLKIIDFDMKQDAGLLEVIFNGKRIFVKLIGIRTPFNQKTVKYLKKIILHTNVFLEKERSHIVYEDSDYLIHRYIWLEMPEDIINRYKAFDKLINVKLLREGYAKPILYKDYPIKYETYYLDAYQRGRQKLLEEIEEEKQEEDKKNENENNIFNTDFGKLFDSNSKNEEEDNDTTSDNSNTKNDNTNSYTNGNRAIDKKSGSLIDNSDYDILENGNSTTSYSTCDINCPVSRRTGARCKDGTESVSTGRGTCSGHGGVECWYCN